IGNMALSLACLVWGGIRKGQRPGWPEKIVLTLLNGIPVMNMNIKPIFQSPYERAGVLTPGLPILPHGVERHPIPGGGSRAVRIMRGDEITVQDREGLQPVELVFFAPDGCSDAGMIGARGGRDPAGLKAALMADPS